MDAISKELDVLAAQIRGKYEASVKKMQAGLAFDNKAAALCGGRKMNRAEASLIKVW